MAPYAQCDELSPLHPITTTDSLPPPIGIGLRGGIRTSHLCQQRTFTSRQKGCELTLMAGNVATLHAAPLPTNVASMKSMVADSSIQVRWAAGAPRRA